VDEATGSTWYLDSDNDGHGDPNSSLENGCDGANFLVSVGDDCDDENANINPDETEVCNGKDDDCDEDVDDEDTSLDVSTQKTWYFDNDDDGFGDEDIAELSCSKLNKYVEESGDCNDMNASVFPDATEVCDELDNDCDINIDEGVGTYSFIDADGDGFGNLLEAANIGCGVPEGYVLDSTDCDDTASHTHPGAEEICDGKDNNCNGVLDVGDSKNLCDDGNDLTFDTCDNGKCVYEDVMFVFTCELPDGFSAVDGYKCGAGVFFDDEDGYSEVLMIEEGVLTLSATDVCAQIAEGFSMYVNSYVVLEEVDLAFLWLGGQYVTVTESLNDTVFHGTPGNVTVLFPGLDFVFDLSDIMICQ
jgi:hypothetical protein